MQPRVAVVRYTIPMPEDNPIGLMDSEEVVLHSPIQSFVKPGGTIPDRNLLSDFIRHIAPLHRFQVPWPLYPHTVMMRCGRLWGYGYPARLSGAGHFPIAKPQHQRQDVCCEVLDPLGPFHVNHL